MTYQNRTITFSELLDESTFQAYTELYLIPHDKSGKAFIKSFGMMSVIIGVLIAALFSSRFSIYLDPLFQVLVIALFLFFFILSISFLIIGTRMYQGLRRPKWNTFRWYARTKIAFYRLQNDDTKNPLCVRVPKSNRPNDDWPLPLRYYYLLIIVPTRFDFFLKYDYCDTPLAYDTIPGILPRFKDVPKDVELSVQFSGTFYSDHIEKGSHGVVFAESYDDIHDVVEDQEKYPGLAIIRHKDGYSELVVFTDKLEGGTWDEVKKRIAGVTQES